MIMEATTRTFTAQDWAEHEEFVKMFRAAKQRKREREAQIQQELKARAEYLEKEYARMNAIYKELDDEAI